MTAYHPTLLLRIFIPFALGYFLSYLFRVVNSIIAGNLSNDLNINAAELGLLTSTYLITFAAIQLPLGVMLDRYGPRRIEALLLLFAAAGSALFAMAESFKLLLLGRALIGLGVSACLMAAFKAFVQWFPAERLPLINGLHMTAGGMGILFASAPTEYVLHFTDWRGLFWILAFLTLIVAAIVFAVVPEKPGNARQSTLGEHIGGFSHVFSDHYFWRIIPLAVSTQAATLAIIGLWTGPWFRDVALYNRSEVATALTLIAVALIAGFLLIGFAADRLRKRGISSLSIALGGMAIFILIQVVILFEPVTLAIPLWMLFAFFSTSAILIYAVLSQRFAPELAGRVNTAFNFLTFVIAFFAQWGIGAVINSFGADQIGHYASEGYQLAFACLIVMQVLSMLWYACYRVR
ncbi:MAG: MFS transporter [Gammaproteobacteria bacterium]|nr:MFS transporter [Gammaproteobacteria bacterium]